jgi:hypothetical protein
MYDQSVHFTLTLDMPPILGDCLTLAICPLIVFFLKKSEAIDL